MTERETSNADRKEATPEEQTSAIAKPPFNSSDFKIMKGRLGEIQTGMTIQEAESRFSGLSKKTDEATNFGFGGGSPAYLYYDQDEIIFGLIPKLDTDTLLFIIAAHKDLKTLSGVGPGSSVSELLIKYPDLHVYQDLMNGGEVFSDAENGWEFVFMTSEENQIGEYPELEAPSKAVRLTPKVDWVTIR